MIRALVILLTVFAGGACWAGTAAAAPSSMTVTPVGAGGRVDVGPFDLAGARWRGRGTVELRARRANGRWTPWYPASPEAGDRPDADTREGRADRGWQVGSPWWVGNADRLELRTRGPVRDLRAITVRSPEVRVPFRRPAATGRPLITPRAFWGADESIVRAAPTYATAVRFALVHHTAGQNGYTRSEAPAIVKGIQLYHVRGNGWNDIGYNFLVDRFGVIYEGRAGGVDRNVVGAHALGFNTGSVGVALLGTQTSVPASPAAEKAIAGLLAWRLDLAHVDPLSTLTVISGGSDRFPQGLPVLLPAVSGHRDTGLTTCPGDALYARLGSLAAQAQAEGLPKLYGPTVEGAIGSIVTFAATLSEPLDWSIAVTDAAGLTVASITSYGETVAATWDASAAAPGSYIWTITAGTGERVVTTARGPVGSTVAGPATGLAFRGASAEPETVSPNGDGQAETALVTYTLSAAGTVRGIAVDQTGTQVAEVERLRWRRAGEHTMTFDPAALPDGLYTVRLEARGTGGVSATTDVPVAVTRTLGGVQPSAQLISPNADGRFDTLDLAFTLSQPADVKFSVRRGSAWIATPFAGRLEAGAQSLNWDGTKRLGRVRDGSYDVLLEATDPVATSVARFTVTSDTTAPRLRFISRGAPRIAIGEPADVRLVVNGARRRIEAATAGTYAVPGVQRVVELRARARDLAGNETILRIDRRAPK